MSKYFFGLHSGHLTTRAEKIAKRHGAWHINYTEPDGKRRGWFCCPSRWSPFDAAVARAVMADIDAAGGIDTFRRNPRGVRHED